MINFEANVFGSLKRKKPLLVSVPKKLVENNKLSKKKILLIKFEKNEKSFIDIVPLQEINYKGYLTQRGIQAKNVLQNLFSYLKNSLKRLNDFNSILKNFDLGKIWVDKNVRIKTKWTL